MDKEIKYKCEVDFMCPTINQIKSIAGSNIKDDLTRDVVNNHLEKLRIGIDELRSWGHNLRKELIANELAQNKNQHEGN